MSVNEKHFEDFVILIPAYNTERTIGLVVKEAMKFIQHIIVVDDGSSDKTAEYALKEGAIVLEHKENKGKGRALKTGFDFILSNFPKKKAILTLDADGQHNPVDIPALIQKFENSNAGMVIGSRIFRWGITPLIRIISNKIACFFIYLATGKTFQDTQSGFRSYSAELIKKAKLSTDGYEMETELIFEAIKLGYKIEFVPVQTIYQSGKDYVSHFKPIKDFLKIARLIIREIIKRIFYKD